MILYKRFRIILDATTVLVIENTATDCGIAWEKENGTGLVIYKNKWHWHASTDVEAGIA